MNDQPRISDERLFIRYAEGDRSALRHLMEKHTPGLLRFCQGYLKDEAEAEDAVQETFVRAIRSAATYRATHKFSTWLYAIARNHCRDILKVRSRRTALRDERREYIAETTMGAPAGDVSRADHSLSVDTIEEALRLLTAREAETIRLTFFEEWSTRQIADLQKCSLSTVRVRRHHALEKLRTLLAGRIDLDDRTADAAIHEEENRHGQV